MIRIGLTGSIGMGKSTAAGMLARMGCAVHDADAAVHRLLAPGGAAVAPVRRAFPEAAAPARGIDRARLAALAVGGAAAMARLEAVLHPLVRADQRRLLARLRRMGFRRPVVFDVPLLFETGAQRHVEVSCVVWAPAFIQRRRVLARPGMTAARLEALAARQMPDRHKRARADFVIPTGLGRGVTARHLKAMLRRIETAPDRFGSARPHPPRPGD